MKQDFTVNTLKEKQIVDITGDINNLLKKIKADEGIAVIQVLHTTCAITTADLDPGTDEDYLEAIEKIFPEGKWNHPHDPSHVGDHIMSSLIGPSIVLNVENGELDLGTWQSVILIELSGPRPRKISINYLKS